MTPLSIANIRKTFVPDQHARKRRTARRGLSATAIIGLLAIAASPAHTEPKEVMDATGPLAEGKTPKSIEIASGDGNVATQTGSFNYSFPIAVPPGRLGAAPSLALSYSSDAPMTGGIAAGWSLSGIPAIERDWSDGAKVVNLAGEVLVPVRWTSGLAGGRELIETNEPAPSSGTSFRAQADSSYARYQYLDQIPSNTFWRVLTTNGGTLYFGERDYMGFTNESDWFPLTRSVDRFGNEVRYHWVLTEIDTDVGGQADMGVHRFWQIDKIEYSRNPAAGTVSHAEVRFVYDTGESPCVTSAVTPGAAHSSRSGASRVTGYYPLWRIQTVVRSGGQHSSLWRLVTQYDLTYSSESDCTLADRAPMRLLEKIETEGFDQAGAETKAPPISFTYGGQASYGTNKAILGAGVGLLAHGQRDDTIPFQSSTREGVLLDINGDGLVDQASSVQITDGSNVLCGVSWRRNLGRSPSGQLEFAAAIETRLPTIPWQNGTYPLDIGSPGAGEFCSLSGQFSLHFVPQPGWETPPDPYAGVYLVYSFRDMTRDGVVDVVSALSGVGFYLGPNALGYRLPDAICPQLDGMQSGPSQCEGAEPVPPQGCEYKPPNDLDYMPRKMIGSQGCYLWRIHKNQPGLPGARVFSQHLNLHGPFAVTSDEEDIDDHGSNGKAHLALTQAVDLTGDGYVDFLKVKRDPWGDFKWYLYRFDGTEVQPGLLFWDPPSGQGILPYPSISYTQKNAADPDYTVSQRGLLLDLNADGLPDFVQQEASATTGWIVRYNQGASFSDQYDLAVGPGSFPTELTEALVDRPHMTANEGTRYQQRRLQQPHSFGPHSTVSSVGDTWINLGNGAFLSRTLAAGEDYREIVDFAPTTWKTRQNAIDMNGDGLTDRVIVDTVNNPPNIPTAAFLEPVLAPRGKLQLIDNGRGLLTAVTYEPAADSDSVTIGDAELPNPKWVVTKVRTVHSHGNVPAADVDYTYDTPVRTEDDRGMLAFRGWQKTTATGPSGAVTETEYGYSDDHTGRVVTTITRQSATDNPTSITDTDYEKQFLTLSSGNQLYVFSSRSDEFNCEHLSSGNTATKSEASCRATVNPRTELSVFAAIDDPTYGTVAFHAKDSLSGELTGDTSLDGFHSRSFVDSSYSADSWLIVPTTSESYRGIAIHSGGVWSLGGELSGVETNTFDASLRFLERTCTARDISELKAGGEVNEREGVCTAYAYDPTTGNVVRTQRPNQFFADVVTQGQPALSSYVQETRYDNAETLDPLGDFKLFPLVTLNELGHEVMATFDLGTGAELSVRGANHQEKSRVEIDGFGRVLKREANVGYSVDDYRVTHENVYDDLTSPQSVTQRIARWLPNTPANNNDTWTEIRTEYDGGGRPITVTEWNLDSNVAAAITSYQYDNAGNLVTVSAPDPSAQVGLGTVDYVRAYDALGRATCMTLPNGSGTLTTYGGLAVSVREFAGGGNCANPSSPATEPTSMKTVTSDALGRVEKVEEVLDIGDTGNVATTRYDYDDNNNVAAITRWVGATANANSDIVTELVHDWVGSRLAIQRHSRVWQYTYDRNGNQLTELQPFDPASGNASDYTSSSLFDNLDRVTSSLPATADLTASEETEFNVGATTYEYDNGLPYDRTIGRLAQTADPNGVRAMTYKYDSLGNTREVVNDIDLNPIGVPFSDTFTEGFPVYASSGKPLYIDHASGVRTVATYRRGADLPYTLRTVQAGTSATIEDFFTIVRNAASVPRYMYHQNLRPGQGIQMGRTIHYAHDNVGRVTSAASNGNAETTVSQTFAHTGTGEITGIVSTVGTLLTPRTFSFDYDDRHQLTNASDDQGFTGSYSFHRQGQLEAAFVAAAQKPGAVTYPRDVEYVYSDPQAASGQRDPEIIDELKDRTTGETYASYEYDVAGSMIARSIDGSTAQFRYDGSQRIRRRTAANGSVEDYYYTGPNRWLAAEHVGSGRKLRLWIGSSEFHYSCASASCAEEQTRTNIVMGGRTVARVEQDPADNRTTKVLQANGLGHLLGVLSYVNDGSGTLDYTLEAGFQYGPFGEILEAGNASGANADDYLQRFNGKEYDTASGLSYYGYRYYDPVSLTWNRSDPLYRFTPEFDWQEPRAGNLYSFNRGNPVRYFDPDGRDSECGAACKAAVISKAMGWDKPSTLDYLVDQVALGAVDFVVETADAIAHPIETAKGTARFAYAVATDPVGTYNQAVEELSDAMVEKGVVRAMMPKALGAGKPGKPKASAVSTPRSGRKQVTRYFPDRKRRNDARRKPKPHKPKSKRTKKNRVPLTRQKKNQKGMGQRGEKHDRGGRHVHDDDHNNPDKPNVHYESRRKRDRQ